MARFTEAQIKAVGGLFEQDYRLPGLDEMMRLAPKSCERFQEALAGRGSAKRWLAAAVDACGALREAQSETALGFLVRKGIQTVANDWYNVSPAVWREYARVEGSTTVAEWYGPLYPSVIAGRVERGQQFPEGRTIGEESSLVNQKFGMVEGFDRELFDDDQTGQIRDRARNLGASMTTTESIWSGFRYLGAARTYANLTVPASTYATTDINGTAVSTPFSATLYGASLGNRPSTYVALGASALKVALVTLLNAVDPLQNKIVVTPNYLLVSSQDSLNADILLAPGGYPAVIGQGGNTLATQNVLGGTTSVAGATQGVFPGFPGGWTSPNPFAGLGLRKIVERYWPDWAWAIGEKGRGFVFQERDPLEIAQEAPNSGAAFTFDSLRYRSRRRFTADWVGGGSRFAFLGNDGTATGNQ